MALHTMAPSKEKRPEGMEEIPRIIRRSLGPSRAQKKRTAAEAHLVAENVLYLGGWVENRGQDAASVQDGLCVKL